MSAEKIETSEAVYRDIYGKTKKKRRTKDQRRNAIRLLNTVKGAEIAKFHKVKLLSQYLGAGLRLVK